MNQPPPCRASGFTLVEIMVVVVILGLLATLVVQNVIRHADEARLTKARTDVVAIAQAASLFRAQRGRVPQLADLTARDGDKRPLIADLPRDPWNHDYEIVEGETPGDFVVVSAGPDGAIGSDDDIRSGAAR
jgi:general secretion pathway protein G